MSHHPGMGTTLLVSPCTCIAAPMATASSGFTSAERTSVPCVKTPGGGEGRQGGRQEGGRISSAGTSITLKSSSE
jgi:hypothetical protein